MPRILVIDDDEQVRTSLRETLASAGYQAGEAADGAQGLQAYRRQPADVVLCDLLMPRLEGLETIQKLRRSDPRVRVVAMSGGTLSRPEDFLPVAARVGATATLHKPFEERELLQLLALVLS